MSRRRYELTERE